MKRHNADRAEIGLQVIADTLAGVDLVEQRKRCATPNTRSTAKERRSPAACSRGAARARAARRRADGAIADRSCCRIPADERYRLKTSKTDYSVRFGRLIEQQPDWIWTAIEPLHPGPPRRPPCGTVTKPSPR